MLLVNAKKGPSPIHGFGLIAQEFIPEGTVIWKFTPGFDLQFSEEKIALLSDAARIQVLNYKDFPFRVLIVFKSIERLNNVFLQIKTLRGNFESLVCSETMQNFCRDPLRAAGLNINSSPYQQRM